MARNSAKGASPSGRRRRRKPASAPAAARTHGKKPDAPAPQDEQRGVFTILREWIDPLVFAYILAMFIRTFFVELFKIPSGSMTPTLIGDEIAEVDYDGDGDDDLIVGSYALPGRQGQPQFRVFIREDGRYALDRAPIEPKPGDVPLHVYEAYRRSAHIRYDRICVNKFAYWFKQADRGDIVVFKVPRSIYEKHKPVYVKRVVGLPDETIEIRGDRLWVNGARVEEPEFLKDHYYTKDYARDGYFDKAELGPAEYLMFGDNTASSLDGRAWGPAPADNFRGKAFFRYMPFSKIRLLR